MQRAAVDPPIRQPPSEAPLTAGEAARRVRCHRVTIWRAIDNGDLRAVRLGPHGSYRIHREALDEWLQPAGPTEETIR